MFNGQTNGHKLSEFVSLEELTLHTHQNVLRDTLRELTEPLHTVRKLDIRVCNAGLDAYTVRRIVHYFPRLSTLTLQHCEMSAEGRAVWDKSALKDVELILK